MKYVNVVSACIINNNKEMLITKRKSGFLTGLYEFPGGKIENNETEIDTIKREIKEELNLDIEVISYIDRTSYTYTTSNDGFDLSINLSCYLSRIVSGDIKLNDHSEYRWINPSNLDEYEFSKADKLLFDSIKKEIIIEQIKDDVKELFKNDHSGHDYYHTLRVLKNSITIMNDIKCDRFKVKLIALLHDTDDRKLFNTVNNENARKILNKYNITDLSIIDDINDVSFKGDGKTIPKSIEGKIVQDADRLDALGAIGIARCFEYGGAHNRKMYDKNIKPRNNMDTDSYHNDSNQTTINHFYEKLFKLKDLMNFKTSQKLANERTEYMKEYIKEFFEEIE